MLDARIVKLNIVAILILFIEYYKQNVKFFGIMETWGVYFAVGILSVFGFGILLFLVFCNAHLDEIRMDWESRRERNHDRMRARDKRLKKKFRFSQTA